jgi:transposase-like protein
MATISSPKNLREFDALFPSESAARTYLIGRRWPKGVVCPKCGNDKVYALPSRPFHWVCKAKTQAHVSVYRFSLYVGTIFENTNYPLLTWFKVLFLMLSSKKGMSALQIHRMIGTGSYQTAWYMSHRLRAGLADPNFRKLMGIVEVDETFIGGKDRNRHASKRGRVPGMADGSGKTGVIGAISRKGNVVCQIVERLDSKTLTRFVREAVSQRVSLLATDTAKGYQNLPDEGYRHATVNHEAGEYVRGAIHTNTIESFWSLLKRGVVGTYHNVSKKYLPLYLNEFMFRFNNRRADDLFARAVAGC